MKILHTFTLQLLKYKYCRKCVVNKITTYRNRYLKIYAVNMGY